MKILDLRIGNPAYLSEYFADRSELGYYVDSNEGLDYDLNPGHSDLKETIKKLHTLIGNAKVEGKHIVIGNGATQLINAALSLSVPRGGNVLLRRPYWNRFPLMFKQCGVRLATDDDTCYSELVVSPNNPTNEVPTPSKSPNRIYDLSYNWPQYCEVTQFDEKVMIFSLTKSTGLAGTRIGWAVVADEALAKKMEDFIDVTSGGVSRESQTRAELVLSDQRYRHLGKEETVFDFAKKKLSERWEKIQQIQHPDFKVLNNSGMFIWAQFGENASEKLLQDFGIQGICGEKCGGNRSQVRINVGCSDEDFDEFLRRINHV